MADSVLTENMCPLKKPRLEKGCGESNYSFRHWELRKINPYDDEYIRQYVLYYYQFHKSEGFVIDWEKLDYRFDTMPLIEPYRFSEYWTNDEIIREVACCAISKHNAEKGTELELVDHVSASYMLSAGVLYWITFSARDLASSSSEPILYQTKVGRCGPTFCEILIFRPKPTDEEIAAVEVDLPPPLNDDDPELPTISFTVKGPGSGYMSIPDVHFTRTVKSTTPNFLSLS